MTVQTPSQLLFITDDEICRRLEQLESQAQHLGVLIGTMTRELAALRELLARA